MSRIIELSNTVIKQPELLQPAIEHLNNLKNYGVINAKYQQDKTGRIVSGSFHLKSEANSYGTGNVFLRYEGHGQPVYDLDGILKSGHFRLLGDEDYPENKKLGTLISDHYNAQVVKNHFERQGQHVHMEYGANGEITIEAEENENLAACSY